MSRRRRSLGTVPIALFSAVFASFLPVESARASNDPLFAEQWALGKIQAEAAWAHSRGDGIRVAVVDTGVDFNHEDLAGKGAGSFNCIKDAPIENPCDPVPDGDDNGHGTQVSGIIAAVEGNAKGIAPVAPGASILSFKALAADGSGSLSDVIRGIRSAADNRARVINLSLGPEVNLINDLLNLVLGQDPQGEFREAFQYAAERGALVVAAAGNSGTSSFFAGLENVYVVGSTGPSDEVAFYSSSGAEIFAPGGNSRVSCNPSRCVNTTSPGGYKALQGTSFAAPHVSGLAALVMAQGLSASQAEARIDESADPVASGERINALRAVSAGSAAPPPPPPKPRPVAAPKPSPQPPSPPAPPAIPLPPLPTIEVEVPILVLSSSEAQQAPPPKRVAAQEPDASRGMPWVMVVASLLAAATGTGHLLLGFTGRRSI